MTKAMATHENNIQLAMLVAFREMRSAELEQFGKMLIGNQSPSDMQRLANRDVGRWAEQMVELHRIATVADRLTALPLLALLEADRLRQNRDRNDAKSKALRSVDVPHFGIRRK